MEFNGQIRERHSFMSENRQVQSGDIQEVNRKTGIQGKQERKTEADVSTQSVRTNFFIILIVSNLGKKVFFFSRKYDLCSSLYARMSIHISILTLPSSVLRRKNHSSIKPQPCRHDKYCPK